MSEKSSGRLMTFLIPALAVVIIILGLVLAVQTASRNRQMMLESQDARRMGTAQSVDNNIFGHFAWYCSDLEYVTSQEDFLEAERIWLETGKAERLLYYMRENPLPRSAMVETILAAKNGQPVLSISGQLDYTLLTRLGQINGADISIYTDGAGRPCIAMVLSKERLDYVALIDAESFFSIAENKTAADSKDRIYLLDATGEYFFYHTAGEVRVERVAELAPESDSALGRMLTQQWTAAPDNVFFFGDIQASGSQERLTILPAAANTNGCFTVGLVNSHDDPVGLLRSATFQMVGCSCIVLAGVALLLFFLLRTRRDNQQAQEELILLRTKAEAMEKLNAQAQEFAHHQRLELMGTMTSSIAHEFNNLLTPIMGYSILILEKLPSEDTESYDNAMEIYTAAQKAKEIISRLSNLSRKNPTGAFRRVELDALARQVLEVAAPARPKNVSVETSFACPGMVLLGNETQLSQLMLNLILNAFESLEEQGGAVRVSTSFDDRHIRLRVADNGPGIPEDIREKIFDPFFTTKGSGKGTGLGLPIVQQIAEEHQGVITLDSSAGQGTAFTVTFPAVPSESAED